MRPSVLFPIFADIRSLPGIGPRLQGPFERVAGPRIVDLLWTLPTGLIDRRHAPKVADAAAGEIATLTVRIDAHEPPDVPRRPYRVIGSDETGFIALVFFHAKPEWLQRTYPVGQIRVVSGRVDEFGGGRQMTHPDFAVPPDEADSVRIVQPVYPLAQGLTRKTMQRAVDGALDRAPDLAEWADEGLLAARHWPGWQAALRRAHRPEGGDDLMPDVAARARLAYDELLATQLALLLVRQRQRRLKGRPLAGDGGLRRRIVDSLPFALTGSQEAALAEIGQDMAAPARMARLLQGDVGSGKTIVALLAMAAAVEAGGQAALMAPTEILARQHFATIRDAGEAAGLRIALLTGRRTGAKRQALTDAIAAGEIDIAVGTHALFSGDIAFRDLALIVIDEQHRFGVQQRMALAGKGSGADMLAMTATPIPRTLMLAAYGDIDSSKLTEKPAGRQPVDTRAMPMDRLDEVAAGIGRTIGRGAQAFWICPLVDESDDSGLTAATARHAWLQDRFGDRAELVHGRMSPVEKDAAMQRFIENRSAVLVATTVVEVGVDVPNADVMVIEHAERFGLAQLHQLRGRVGRGTRKGSCVLLYEPPLGETARARIDVLRRTDDGFAIAEEDLRLRGGGEALGTRQSGMPAFRLAQFPEHADLLEIARTDARLALERDPDLAGPRGPALRTLLYLFEREEGVRMLRSG